MSPEELQYVEDFGAYMEALGASRMAGRVWGTLVITEEPELTAAEIAEELGASAGSISTATRLLIGYGMIDRRRQPGERKDYFAVRPDSYITLLRRREHAIEMFTDLIRRGQRLVGDRELASQRLNEFEEFYIWLSDRFHLLINQWHEERSHRTEHT